MKGACALYRRCPKRRDTDTKLYSTYILGNTSVMIDPCSFLDSFKLAKLCKISGFHSSHYEECRLLKYYVAWLL
jgi:hypothetical protein